jgi:hypothetical protein
MPCFSNDTTMCSGLPRNYQGAGIGNVRPRLQPVSERLEEDKTTLQGLEVIAASHVQTKPSAPSK